MESTFATMDNAVTTRRLASAIVIASAICVGCWAFEQPAFALAPPPKATLSGFFKAMAAEDHAEAKRQADQLLPVVSPADRARIVTAYGRVLLGLGESGAVRDYLETMGKEPLDDNGLQLMTLYKAWLDAINGRPQAAIDSLETFIRGHEHTLAAAEAADVLAILYLARDDQTSAKRSVDYGLATVKYLAVQTDYLEALLRHRLVPKVATSEAERLYLAAEKLRLAGTYQEAAMRFAVVRQNHADSLWAHASGFRIGQCLASLGRRSQAVEHWQGFVAEQPAGPWRGQAQVSLIDGAVDSLNLAAATKHGMEASAALSGTLSEQAARSWADAALDIYTRQAIVAFVDRRFDAAARACEQATTRLREQSKGVSAHAAALACLAGLARQQHGILPEDVDKGASTKTHAALSLGCISLAIGRPEAASKFFGMVSNGGSAGANSQQRSFAQFGLARANLAASFNAAFKKETRLQRQARVASVTRAYLQSLTENPAGSWHDETLRDLALYVEREAGDPLSHWSDHVRRFPKSRHAAEALFHVGNLAAAAERPADAIRAFERLIKEHPASPWTGDAAVRLIDVRLEREYDLPGATELAEAAVAWLDGRGNPKQEPTGLDAVVGSTPPSGHHLAAAFDAMEPAVITATADQATKALPTTQQSGYAIFLRAGLVEYLLERPEAAVAFFEKAKPLAPSRDYEVVVGHVPTGLERLTEVARSGAILTPGEVRSGDPKAKLILMLADAYHEAEEWAKSLELCSKVLDGVAPKATRSQKSWAFFRRGRNYFCLDDKKDPHAALADYEAAIKAAPTAWWSPEALLLAANIHWNTNRDADAAIAAYQRLIRGYPASEHVACAAYFTGVMYEWSDRPDAARNAFQIVLEKHRGSRYAKGARGHLDDLDAATEQAR